MWGHSDWWPFKYLRVWDDWIPFRRAPWFKNQRIDTNYLQIKLLKDSPCLSSWFLKCSSSFPFKMPPNSSKCSLLRQPSPINSMHLERKDKVPWVPARILNYLEYIQKFNENSNANTERKNKKKKLPWQKSAWSLTGRPSLAQYQWTWWERHTWSATSGWGTLGLEPEHTPAAAAWTQRLPPAHVSQLRKYTSSLFVQDLLLTSMILNCMQSFY